MGRTGQDGIGGSPEVVVEADETSIITDDWSSYVALWKRGYLHTAALREGNCCVAETFLPIIHLVFSHLKTWLRGIHHGVSPQHLAAKPTLLPF